jgi:hypothetical protein
MVRDKPSLGRETVCHDPKDGLSFPIARYVFQIGRYVFQKVGYVYPTLADHSPKPPYELIIYKTALDKIPLKSA